MSYPVPQPRRTVNKHVIAYPLVILAALGAGAAATSSDASSQQPVPSAAPVTTTATATTTSTTTTTTTATVTAKPTAQKVTTITQADDQAVQQVLNAWQVVGPRPDQQKAAMVKLQREWPTLAKALQSATGVSPRSISVPKTARKPAPKPAPTTVPDVYYANCTAVRAAGAAPLHAGEPGYRAGLDRDGDGTACE